MGQDIREMFRKESFETSEKLEKGHEQRFEARLKRELPVKKNGNSFLFLKIAAVFLVALGIGFAFFKYSPRESSPTEVVTTPVIEEEEKKEEEKFQLSDVSPEFKKIENYYLAGINMELAKLEVNDNNKALIDAFMLELQELDKEYQRLNLELKEFGPNPQTIEAMIKNLQLRLESLLKLQNKLKEIKSINNNTNSYENSQA